MEKKKVNNIHKVLSITLALVLSICSVSFASKEDLMVGPGLEDMQIAGSAGSGYPQSVTSNGLTVTPNFDTPISCSLNITQGLTVHYNFPTVNFNFTNNPAVNSFVNEQFNFLLNYNMKNVLTNNYKNNEMVNSHYFGTGSKRKNWTMNKVGLKTFDGNTIELEFSSPDYKEDGMVKIKATYDIANNTLTLH